MKLRESIVALGLVVTMLVPGAVVTGAPATGVDAVPDNQQVQARVIHRYGAGMREEPSADSEVIHRGGCNDVFRLVGDNGPWKQVFMVIGLPDEQTEDEEDDLFGWMLADHVAVGAEPPAVDCGSARGHQVGSFVESWVEAMCIALSDVAGGGPGSECRVDGHKYRVTSGPMMAGAEEWFELEANGGGRGWAPARALIPNP